MTTTHTGSCHCGNVKFQVEIDPAKGTMCNCRICTKIGNRSGMVKPAAFKELTPPSQHAEYPNQIGKRVFCPTCGVHTFGFGSLPELGGDFVSINLNALDGIDAYKVELMHWDGRHDNWHAGPRATPWPVFAETA
ncbi:MAG TPA: GFA family protein [Kofleriaceae bacterium]|jgi:hypothetical protein